MLVIYRTLLIIVLVSVISWYLTYLIEKNPPWLHETLMIMIDPALPLAVELRDRALNQSGQ